MPVGLVFGLKMFWRSYNGSGNGLESSNSFSDLVVSLMFLLLAKNDLSKGINASGDSGKRMSSNNLEEKRIEKSLPERRNKSLLDIETAQVRFYVESHIT